MGVTIAVTTAAANAVNLVDIGTDADTDGFVDGISIYLFIGFSPVTVFLVCPVARPLRLQMLADEVELVVSGDPGGDTVIVLKFFGISALLTHPNGRKPWLTQT